MTRNSESTANADVTGVAERDFSWTMSDSFLLEMNVILWRWRDLE